MNTSPIDVEFLQEKSRNITAQGTDTSLQALSLEWNLRTAAYKYTYNFSAFGRPIIQFPQDMVAVQELIWSIRPDLIIETGIAHGGSLLMSAGMLALLDYCDATQSGTPLDTAAPRRRVLGIDIDIRSHNRDAILAHPLSSRIDMIEGSSISEEVVGEVQRRAASYSKVLVLLDSNHTHSHVLAELEAYAGLVSIGSYCVVFDTVIEDLPKYMFPDRPWGPGNNPKTAVGAFLANNPGFEVDREIESKLLITVAPGGYLRRVA